MSDEKIGVVLVGSPSKNLIELIEDNGIEVLSICPTERDAQNMEAMLDDFDTNAQDCDCDLVPTEDWKGRGKQRMRRPK